MLFSLILLLAFISGYVLPWWVACILAFGASIIMGRTSTQVFWAGFAGIALAWIALALLKSFPNNHILAMRVAKTFHLPHWLVLLAVTALIGGLAGGFSALSGLMVKRVFEKKDSLSSN
jgi:CDP-diglyceride synthetase